MLGRKVGQEMARVSQGMLSTFLAIHELGRMETITLTNTRIRIFLGLLNMKRNGNPDALVAIVFALVGLAATWGANAYGSEPITPEAIASTYVVDFVSTAAFSAAMNDAGDVTGS